MNLGNFGAWLLIGAGLLLALPNGAQAQTDTYIVGASGSSYTTSNYYKANVYTVTGTTVVQEMSMYFSASSGTVRYFIAEETTANSYSEIWSQTVTGSSAGYHPAYPGVTLDAGETYAIGMHFSGSTTYDWQSSSPSDPGWGYHDGYVSLNTSYSSSWYDTLSATGAYRGTIVTSTNTDNDFDGWETPDDCDDSDPQINPGALEVCDGLDNNCDGVVGIDENDADFDGYLACLDDCDDFDGSTYPGAPEVCDSWDNDCDGAADEGLDFDADADGYTSFDSCGGTADDCDDFDAAVNVAASETCDYLDNNCDGSTDEGFTYDGDFDFFTDIECGGDDCDDEDPTTFPQAPELCDGVDNDCDGVVPDGEGEDNDNDGDSGCTDCDDENPDVFNGQTEDCSNGIDDNCNGEVDESGDGDGDGYGACDDCDDADPDVNPGAEEDTCNGIDDDCDGALDPDETDDDADGVRPCEGDCDDDNELVYPEAEEVCDGYDNDCDGEFHPEEGDENDADGDGIPICFDCDDEDPDVFPGAEEDVCDAIDNDCDGEVGEPEGDECDDDDGGGGGGGRRRGCDLGGGAGLGSLLLLALARRRS